MVDVSLVNVEIEVTVLVVRVVAVVDDANAHRSGSQQSP